MEPKTFTNKQVLVKALIIGGLSLALLAPTFLIEMLVQERRERQHEVSTEVGLKWGLPQTLHGFVLAVLYSREAKTAEGKTTTDKKMEILQPVNHNLSTNMQVQLRKRSIYRVPLYEAANSVTDRFSVNKQSGGIPQDAKIEDVRLCLPVTDRNGLNKDITVTVNGNAITLNTETSLAGYPDNVVAATVDPALLANGNDIVVTSNYTLKGSGALYFYPNGKQNHIELRSPWKHPSFQGYEVPDSNDVSKKGFFAIWDPRQQTGPVSTPKTSERGYDTPGTAFGVAVLQPGDSYAKTMRTIKYAVLVIVLSFSVFFITELVKRIPVHALQYILVGAALVIFYTLLLSVSEYLSYNPAYIIAALATVLLIGSYTAGIYRSRQLGLAFTLFMGLLYAFIFVLIQLQDSALLIGSIGLFIVVAAGMHLTRKINTHLQQNTATTE